MVGLLLLASLSESFSLETRGIQGLLGILGVLLRDPVEIFVEKVPYLKAPEDMRPLSDRMWRRLVERTRREADASNFAAMIVAIGENSKNRLQY